MPSLVGQEINFHFAKKKYQKDKKKANLWLTGHFWNKENLNELQKSEHQAQRDQEMASIHCQQAYKIGAASSDDNYYIKIV